MRVTNIIKEYVTSSVGKKFENKLQSVGSEYRDERQRVIDLVEEIANKANEEAIKVATEHGLYDPSGRYSSALIYTSTSAVCNRERQKEITDKTWDIENEKKRTISDVLLSLELGKTNKDELESVLDAIEV